MVQTKLQFPFIRKSRYCPLSRGRVKNTRNYPARPSSFSNRMGYKKMVKAALHALFALKVELQIQEGTADVTKEL